MAVADGGENDLLKLVDEYRAMLDGINRAKLRGAKLGGEARRRRESPAGTNREARELEELEREIVELREKIAAKQREIKGLG